MTLQRQTARRAVAFCAEKSGIVLGSLNKNDNDAPLPFNGYYWSLTHKPTCTAAIIATEPIGIDLEEIKPRSVGLFRYVASLVEWQLSKITPPTSDDSSETLWWHFFRYWTAKEAVLKAGGIGMADLKKCRITTILNDTELIINYQNKEWLVEHSTMNHCIVAATKNQNTIQWHWLV